MDIFDKYLEDLKSLIGTSKTQATFNKYAVARKHFSSFLKYKYGRNDIMPKELTYIVIHDFDVYLKTVLQLKANSATKTLKFFKTVIIFAQKSGKMTHDPFMNFRFQAEKVDRGFLTDEEIQCMMKKTFDIPRLEQVRDIFIFSCFSGLAYIDMVNLTEDNIVVLDGKKWIIVNRHKKSRHLVIRNTSVHISLNQIGNFFFAQFIPISLFLDDIIHSHNEIPLTNSPVQRITEAIPPMYSKVILNRPLNIHKTFFHRKIRAAPVCTHRREETRR